MNDDLLQLIRKSIPKQIAEALYSVQPIQIPRNYGKVLFRRQKTIILKCSCGKTLLKIKSSYFKEANIKCSCGKNWVLEPICDCIKLSWIWKEKKEE
jgi:hypothetical protein